MKGAMNKILGAAAMAAFVAACSSSDDKDVAGGASGDMGIVASAITGDAQKGPFVKGAAVMVQGIDCKTLQLTDERFEGEVNSDKGDFSVKDVSLKSTCALFEVTGLYRSEITGKTSSKELTLRALTDLKDRESVNINILTNLEYERLVHLVTEKGKTFAEAKAQAEQEVLAAFDIAGSFEEFENLNIFESGDGNAALLAVSVMMQVKTDDAGLAKRIEKFEDSFAETGMWKDSAAKATIEAWQVAATADGTLDSIRKNIETWDIGDTVAAFEKYIEAYADGDSIVLSSSSKAKSSSSSEGASSSSSGVTPKSSGSSENGDAGTSAGMTSSSSSQDTTYNAEKNTLTDTRDGQVYKTVAIGNQVWMAENLNYKTDDSRCYKDSAENCAKYGRLYVWSEAMKVCPEGWHLPDTTEWYALLYGTIGDIAVVGIDEVGRNIRSKSGWLDQGTGGGDATDALGFSVLPGGSGDSSSYNGMGYNANFWSALSYSNWESFSVYIDYSNRVSFMIDDMGFFESVRCVKGDPSTAPVRPSSSSSVTSVSSSSAEVQPNSSETESSSSSGDDKMNCSALLEGETDWNWNVPKECRFNPDIDYGTMIDTRDNKQYKTVKIGDQVWMAENLNFDPGQGGSGDTKYDWSWCHNNKAEHCDVAGRFYTWAAAIDSVKLATDADKTMDCGYGKECGLDSAGSATLIRGICPDGWHLPNNGEWNSLFTAVGGAGKAGTLLKSRTGWYGNGNGTDAFGFTALSVGRSYSYASFDFDGLYAYFWSATENDSSYAYGMYLYYRGDDVGAGLFDSYKNYGFSVRCVKD